MGVLFRTKAFYPVAGIFLAFGFSVPIFEGVRATAALWVHQVWGQTKFLCGVLCGSCAAIGPAPPPPPPTAPQTAHWPPPSHQYQQGPPRTSTGPPQQARCWPGPTAAAWRRWAAGAASSFRGTRWRQGHQRPPTAANDHQWG